MDDGEEKEDDNNQGTKEIDMVETEDIAKEEKEKEEEDEVEEDKDNASSNENQTDTNPRSGAEIQGEQSEEAQDDVKEGENEPDEDSSVELIEPKKLTTEEKSFQILSERSRGIASLTGSEPTEGPEEEKYESIRLFLCTEIRDFQLPAGPVQPSAGLAQPPAGPVQPLAVLAQPSAGPAQPTAGMIQPSAGHTRPSAESVDTAAIDK